MSPLAWPELASLAWPEVAWLARPEVVWLEFARPEHPSSEPSHREPRNRL
jgi:hypothetical protein